MRKGGASTIAVMTQPENWQVAPITQGELSVAFRYPNVSLSQMRRGAVGILPSVHVAQRELDILMASVLQHPIDAVGVVERCGRFLLVDYTPRGFHDPQMIVAWMPGATTFHEAMMDFQRTREGWFADEGPWYKNCMSAAKKVLGPLARLSPCVAEADFVIGWLLHTVATGQRI